MPNQTIAYFTSVIRRSKECTEKEKVILTYRLKHNNLEKIGKKFKLSGERIRQIEKDTLDKFEKAIIKLRLFD